MLNIESKLGLLKNIPKELLGKLSISNTFFTDEMQKEIEVVIISVDNVDNLSQFVDNLGGKYLNLGYNFGIVTIPVDKLLDLASNPKIQYIELPKNLYTTDFQSNRASCVTQISKNNNLTGKGVIVGFLDTGIDYTHPAFLNEDGTTRIEYIYDLSLDGAVYNKETINQALSSPDPFSVVPSRDDVGHGTHVVGIACAGGNINPNYYGVAPESSIMMVKVARSRFALSTEIMKGIRFLIDKSNELNMPLVINISLSTNDGAHNGNSLLEQYIYTVSTVERVTIVVAAGNEGDTAHHVGGKIEETNEIYFNVSSEESIVVINLYKTVLPGISIELTCPGGYESGVIDLSEGSNSGTLGNSRYEVYITGAKPFDIVGEFGIVLTGLNEYVSTGQWKIKINRLDNYEGIFEMWLPISEGLNINTRFLNPTIYNTLGIPATVRNVISVGSYNYLLNTISPFSGRGKNIYREYIKPDIVAPGEGIYSSIPNGSFDRKTGTSMATPNVSGIAALLNDWGIIKGNDPYLYGERLKYFLILGAKKGRDDVSYPDPAWGYGEVCLLETLRLLSVELGVGLRNEEIRQQNPTTPINQSLGQINNNTNTSTNFNPMNNTNTNTSTGTDFNPMNNTNTNANTGTNFSLMNNPNMGTNFNTANNNNISSNVNTNNTGINNVGTNTTNTSNDEKADLTVGVRFNNVNDFYNAMNQLGVNGVVFTSNFGILIIKVSQIDQLRNFNLLLQEEDLNLIYTLNQISPVEASGSEEFNANPYLRLNGQGVLVGIIDTGIDYLNEEFTREDDTSRIFRLWDQTIEGTIEVEGLKYGTEYTEEQLTEAVAAKLKGNDPYEIVPSRDEIGHGTMVAGIVGGRGKNPNFKGVAPDCEFIVVKLEKATKYELDRSYINSNVPTYTSWNIVLAIRYIITIASRYGRPIVIYIPLGSNLGSHEGTSIVSGVINFYEGRVGTIFVTTTGNVGNSQTHTEGKLEGTNGTKDIELQVGRNQKRLPIEIWIDQANFVDLSIISPSGEIIDNLSAKLSRNQLIKFFNEETTMVINYISPEEQTGDNLIIIKADNLREGIWKFRLKGGKFANGEYNAWIPQRELIDKDTIFLQPSSFTTLTTPSSTALPLSVAYYNQDKDAIMVESGRGYTRDGRIKPEIAAGGFDTNVLVPGGGSRIARGASIAGAVVAGGCALILQWAIVKKNDVGINDKKIRAYIIGGARRRDGDVYPNREWGYGIFDLKGVFQTISEVYSPETQTRSSKYEEYYVNRLFIRMPK